MPPPILSPEPPREVAQLSELWPRSDTVIHALRPTTTTVLLSCHLVDSFVSCASLPDRAVTCRFASSPRAAGASNTVTIYQWFYR